MQAHPGATAAVTGGDREPPPKVLSELDGGAGLAGQDQYLEQRLLDLHGQLGSATHLAGAFEGELGVGERPPPHRLVAGRQPERRRRIGLPGLLAQLGRPDPPLPCQARMGGLDPVGDQPGQARPLGGGGLVLDGDAHQGVPEAVAGVAAGTR